MARKMIISSTLYMTCKSLASASFPFLGSHPIFILPSCLNCQIAETHFFSFLSSYGFNDGEPYTIHFFLGSVDGEPSLYEKHPNHIDIVYTFSSRVETVPGSSEAESEPKCGNCAKQKAEGVLSKGQIILTRALLRAATDSNNSELNSLEPGEVNRYLKRHLNWRAVDVSFQPLAFLPSFFQSPLLPSFPSGNPQLILNIYLRGPPGLRTMATRSTLSNNCHGQRSLL